MNSLVLLAVAAVLAVTSADPFPPNQNVASSASESLNAGSLYNHNSYARDDSKIRQLSTTLTNSGESTRDVATAISEPAHLAAIEALPSYYPTPAERLYPYYKHPAVERVVPILPQPVVEQVVPLFPQPSVEHVVPIYNPPAEIAYPYVGLPLEVAYPNIVEQGYYGHPNFPHASVIGVPTEAIYAGLLEAQQQIPFPLPSHGVPLYQPAGFFGEAPVEIVDTTLLEAFYPELPVHTHFSANNRFKSASASATPNSASSESVSDNTAISRDSFPILTQKKYAF
ncbi:hypothetical protein L9F63_012868 [Diploptera punctata]|uniref:Uncharacterized protein n=1 Tax=Diploptera punctata TaxID=6984 RepID=A0AAD8EMB4_DIPPU|nr:hypothetical protein L9F63_012868 [Diploptera punctata]